MLRARIVRESVYERVCYQQRPLRFRQLITRFVFDVCDQRLLQGLSKVSFGLKSDRKRGTLLRQKVEDSPQGVGMS